VTHDSPADRGRHYLNLPGARLVATEPVLETKQNLGITIDNGALMCLYGEAGVGKTLTVEHVMGERLSVETLHIQFRAHPYPRDIRGNLYTALGFSGSPPRRPLECDLLLKRALARRFRVLVCDEAQWMSHECFELWRHLWDDDETQFALIFVGGGNCYRILKSHPMLASRVLIWQEYPTLTSGQVTRFIPSFHPIWTGIDPDLIAYADTHCARGNFRAWARLTTLVQTALRMLDRADVDREVLHWAFSKLN
jgi:hypothetical protein